jgi:hypothetical protein
MVSQQLCLTDAHIETLLFRRDGLDLGVWSVRITAGNSIRLGFAATYQDYVEQRNIKRALPLRFQF